MKFYLGTHEPHWLARLDVPLFVSHRRLARLVRKLPRARVGWALDSGGFTELSMFGGWQTSSAEYIAAVRRYAAEVGLLEWAAPQDWMCEPFIVAKTGLTVEEHQYRTVENLMELRSLAPDLPFVPVLQGYSIADYRRCIQLYDAEHINLTTERTVGIGSVCRRQNTGEIEGIMRALASEGVRLHGFGVKAPGLARYHRHLISADSMAWSTRGRYEKWSRCSRTHASCANCPEWALAWRHRVLATLNGPEQMTLDVA